MKVQEWGGLSAECLTLVLDYDGTLAPIVDRPEDARPDEELGRLLRSLLGARGITPLIVSGRPAGQLAAWLDLPDLGLIGTHGAEWRAPQGEPAPLLAPPEVRALAERAAEILDRHLACLPGAQIERKPYGVAAHDRRVPEARQREFLERFGAALEDVDPGFVVHEGKRVRELRWQGVDKGRALMEVVRRLDLTGDPVLAIGDDRTDEAIFETLDRTDLSIHVGEGDSIARERLVDFREVRDLLGAILSHRGAEMR